MQTVKERRISLSERFPDLLKKEDWAVCVTAAKLASSMGDLKTAERIGILGNRRLGECVITMMYEIDFKIRCFQRFNRKWRSLRTQILKEAFLLAKGKLPPFSYKKIMDLLKRFSAETRKVDPPIPGFESQDMLEEAANLILQPLRGESRIKGKKNWLLWRD